MELKESLKKSKADWRAAQEALKAARKMRPSPERYEALRKAGQMLYDATRNGQVIAEKMDKYD